MDGWMLDIVSLDSRTLTTKPLTDKKNSYLTD
jgi:hypothetical protein